MKFTGVTKIYSLLQKKQGSIASAAVLIMLSYALSLILGFLRERLLLSTFFGCCSAELDVYKAAFKIPDILFQLLVSGSLSTAFIPVYARLVDKNVEYSQKVANAVFNYLLLGFFIFAIVVYIFAHPLSVLITGSFTEQQLLLMVRLTRILLLTQVFFLISSFLTGVLQTYHRFLLPALSPVVYNLGIILGIWFFSDRFGIYAPVLGGVVGAFAHACLQIPLLRHIGFRYQWEWSFRLKEAREILKLMLPRTATLGIYQLQSAFSLRFATSFGHSAYTLFTLAEMLMMIPIRLVGIPVSQAVFPSLSRAAHKNDGQYQKLLGQAILQILYIILPLLTLMMILNLPVVRLAFGVANFPWQATLTTRFILVFFVLAIPCQALINVVVRGFHANKDTRTPLFISLVTLIFFIILVQFFQWQLPQVIHLFTESRLQSTVQDQFSLNFIDQLHLYSLALAISISTCFQLCVMLYVLHRRQPFDVPQISSQISKLLLVATIMAFAVWGPYQFLDEVVFNTTRVLPLMALTVTVSSIGLAVYIFLCHILQVKQQDDFISFIEKFPATRKSIAKLRTLSAIAFSSSTSQSN